MNKRIWELDVLRGICILGMVVVHLLYDLMVLYALVDWQPPVLYTLAQEWGGVLFLLISGICVTLGRRSVRRGLIVFFCGMICSAVTAGMYFLNFSGKGIIIYFGILHCLGVCMLLWPLVKRLPVWALAALGIALIAGGFYLQTLPPADHPWFTVLGLPHQGFVSSDYFPLLPNLGFFLMGAVLGKTLYRKKETLLPRVNTQNPPIRFFLLCGKHSLWIYLLHQPVLSGIFYLIMLTK
ncbi:MAG: DUF1624 domain-containing protein [Ruminococcaceae bacterium]|nr:DUF1624 domain-containing protein [Oscillospiraceae bacterium]